MRILYYPNPILLFETQEVIVFDDALKQTIAEMAKIMLESNGIGLASTQVGLSSKLFIIKDKRGNIVEFINPKIIDTEGTVMMEEGCLSAPGIYLNIVRPSVITVDYQDASGENRRVVAEGLEARVILHEYDHITRKFYFDYVNRQTRKASIAQLKRSLK